MLLALCRSLSLRSTSVLNSLFDVSPAHTIGPQTHREIACTDRFGDFRDLVTDLVIWMIYWFSFSSDLRPQQQTHPESEEKQNTTLSHPLSHSQIIFSHQIQGLSSETSHPVLLHSSPSLKYCCKEGKGRRQKEEEEKRMEEWGTSCVVIETLFPSVYLSTHVG